MSRWAARVIVALRFVLVPLWVGAAVLAVLYLPSLGAGQGGAISNDLLPADASALEAELLSKTQFGVPFIGRTVVVRHEPAGLPPGAVAQAVQTARDVRDGRLPDLRGLAAVIPVPDTALQPGSVPTTILYVLHFWPGTGGAESVEVARRFAAEYVAAGPGEFVGVTGTVPATVARSAVIKEWVPVVTLATIVLIALAVGLFYRSPIAPLVTLLTAGISFVVASGVLGWLGQARGLVVPPEVEPVVVALMFGVVTDYSIFFLSHYRRHLREGRAARDAARCAASEVAGIVGVAGLVVAVSTGALVFAELSFFRVFGPALAVAVLVGALVTITFVPCVLALLGRFARGRASRGPAPRVPIRSATPRSRGARRSPGPCGPGSRASRSGARWGPSSPASCSSGRLRSGWSGMTWATRSSSPFPPAPNRSGRMTSRPPASPSTASSRRRSRSCGRRVPPWTPASCGSRSPCWPACPE